MSLFLKPWHLLSNGREHLSIFNFYNYIKSTRLSQKIYCIIWARQFQLCEMQADNFRFWTWSQSTVIPLILWTPSYSLSLDIKFDIKL